MTSNYQIDYTSRDYASIKQELINFINFRTNNTWDLTNQSDLGAILIEAFSYMGDMLSYYIDRVANETSVTTATKQDTLLAFANLYGYKPSGPSPALVDVSFINNGSSNIDIPIGTQVVAPIHGNPYFEVYFETLTSVTGILPGQTVTISSIEGKTVNTDRPDLIDPASNRALPSILGTSNGAAYQEYILFDDNVVDSSLKVYTGQGAAFSPWTYVSSLLDHGPGETVFTTKHTVSGTTNIVFGDGVNGAIPTANSTISAVYKTSVGSKGNVSSGAVVETTFIPGNTNVEARMYLTPGNSSAAYGGADAETLDQLRSKVTASITTKRRAITLSDYENLAILVPQVGQVKAASTIYSSVILNMQTLNDGSMTPGMIGGSPTTVWNSAAARIKTELSDKIPAGTTITVNPPAYLPLYLSVQITPDPSYNNADIRLAVYKALLGSNGLFNYDSNTFGRNITRSSIIGTLIAVPGVADVTVNALNNVSSISTSNPTSIQLTPSQIAYLIPGNLTITGLV